MFAATIQLQGGIPSCRCVPRPASEGTRIQAIVSTAAATSATNAEASRTGPVARSGDAPPQPTAAQSLGEGGGTAFPGASDIPTGYRGPDHEATNVAKIIGGDIEKPVSTRFDR